MHEFFTDGKVGQINTQPACSAHTDTEAVTLCNYKVGVCSQEEHFLEHSLEHPKCLFPTEARTHLGQKSP